MELRAHNGICQAKDTRLSRAVLAFFQGSAGQDVPGHLFANQPAPLGHPLNT